MYLLIENNRSQLTQWFPRVDFMKNTEFRVDFVQKSNLKMELGEELSYVIIHQNKLIGRIGIYKMDKQLKSGEMGYWLGAEY